MANLIDIRRRIRSVKNTQQITKAMKMVAASKLRRAQERVTAARPYAATLQATLSSLAAALPAGAEGAPAHPLLARREEKNVVLVVVTGDKGLCGAFNTNVLRAAGQFLDERSGSQKTAPRLVVLGRKGHDYFKRRPYQVLDSRPGLFQRFGYDTAAEIARSLAGRFTSGEVDAVYVVFNEFRSVISQVV
ncbi:F0F1 ATP synthase subunit gamma, partial [Acidobacteria bacterium ACD]|nr:F0F1 ATP synthase subunit gamma [Acidobacteria bacterium ACD]